MNECKSKDEVNVTIQVIGGKWKPIILWYLFSGKRRFNELLRLVDGITQKMLTQELRALEKDGIVKRKIYPVVPPKVEYSVTAYAKSLKPVLEAMAAWGGKHRKKLERSK